MEVIHRIISTDDAGPQAQSIPPPFRDFTYHKARIAGRDVPDRREAHRLAGVLHVRNDIYAWFKGSSEERN